MKKIVNVFGNVLFYGLGLYILATVLGDFLFYQGVISNSYTWLLYLPFTFLGEWTGLWLTTEEIVVTVVGGWVIGWSMEGLTSNRRSPQ